MTILTQRFEQALVYATRLHAQQVRKATGIPYISHLLAVCALVLEAGGNEEEAICLQQRFAIAALLHDAVEDQGGEATRTEIYNQFGAQVGAIVDDCTEFRTEIKPPWQERKLHYIQQLRRGSPAARRVALADKLHNMRSACSSASLSLLFDYRQQGEAIWSVFTTGKEGTLWFYHSLLQMYREVAPSPMVEELARVVAALEQLSPSV